MGSAHTVSRTRADLRIAFVLGLGCAVFYAGFTHGSFKSSDEVGVFQVTEALYRDGTLSVPPHVHAHVGADGRLYHAWATGQSVLALPLYATADLARRTLPASWTRAMAGPRNQTKAKFRPRKAAELRRAGLTGVTGFTLRYAGSLEIFFVCLFAPIASGALVAVFFLFVREIDVSRRSALIAALLMGLCSYPATMSVYFLRHTSEAIATLGAFALLHAYRRTGALPWLAWGSAAASATFLVRFPSVLSGLGLGVYVIWSIRERWKSGAAVAPALLAVAGPLAVAIAVHSGLNYARWGSWFLSPMVSGGLESSASFWTSLSAFLWSPGISVFAYSPILLLLPWTFAALWRVGRLECIAIVIIALTELLYFSNYRYWTGLWSAPGPRYLFPACVLLLTSIGAWLDGPPGRVQRGALWLLAGLGALSQLALVTARWATVIRLERYKQYQPEHSFLFVPDASPIVASARAAMDGQLSTWLWNLGAGWPGQPSEPATAVAVGLALVWIAASAALLAWAWRSARELDHTSA
jgi:hypothetical protein